MAGTDVGGRDDSQAPLLSRKERLVPDVLPRGWKSVEGVGHVQEVAPESIDGSDAGGSSSDCSKGARQLQLRAERGNQRNPASVSQWTGSNVPAGRLGLSVT